MWLTRFKRDVVEFRRGLAELFDAPGPTKEEASLDITVSAQEFSRNTRQVVDDKLSFTATLMRAGEVEAANRLVAEVERDVLEEEAALFEKVNEVKVVQAARRERMTRVRVARMLAAAMLGASMLAFSAVGAAVASMLAERNEPEGTTSVEASRRSRGRDAGRDHAVANARRSNKNVRIGGVSLSLSASEIDELRALTSGDVDAAELELFLLQHLPAGLAEHVQDVITAASSTTEAADVDVNAPRLPKVNKAKKKAADEAKQTEEDAKEEPESPPSEPADDPEGSDDEDPDDDEEEDEDGGGLPLGDG